MMRLIRKLPRLKRQFLCHCERLLRSNLLFPGLLRRPAVDGTPRNDMRWSQHGFTLFELVMTIVIVAIIAVPLSITLVQHVESLFKSQDYTMAMTLARYDMERVNNMAYGSIASLSQSNYLGYSYDLTRTVVTQPGAGGNGIKFITVQIRRSGSATVLASLMTYVVANVNYGI